MQPVPLIVVQIARDSLADVALFLRCLTWTLRTFGALETVFDAATKVITNRLLIERFQTILQEDFS